MADLTTDVIIPQAKAELEAKKYIRNPRGRVPKAVAPAVKKIKAQVKLAQKEAANKILEREGGREPDFKKLEEFVEVLFNNGFNLTQAALTVYPTSSVISAGARGSQLFAQAKKHGMVQMAMEKKGYGFGKMMDIALKNVETSRKPEWWDRLMRMGGFDDFIGTTDKAAQVSVNVIGLQKKQRDDFGFADEAVIVGAAQDDDS